MATAAEALRKLTGGQTLTAEEKALLNIGPAVTPAAPATFTSDAAKTAAEDKALADANAAAANTAAKLKEAQDAAALTKAKEDAVAAANANKSSSDPATLALVTALQSQIANLTASQNAAATTAAAQAKATAEANRISAIQVLTDRFTKYGLGSLANKIKELAVDGATEATITLGLQETAEYKQRFAANDARVKAGLQVLTPAEYLNVEDGYRQVLREYGLNQFSTDDYVKKFIENDVSAAELSNRVSIAVQRVQNADPAVTRQLTEYYGIGQGDLIGYVLDPQQQITKIQRQVAAAEIGVAAARQGLTAGASVAEQLAAQGITQAEAQKGYATIADILPTAEKLSSIYGGTMDTYGQSQAEQEVFNSLASAQRKREALTKREVASFSGSSGMAKGLTSSTGGQI
jgi:hypothetical protein